jgi:alpha-glucosidase
MTQSLKIILLLLLVGGNLFAQEMHSPDQKLKVILKSDQKKAYSYSVTYEDMTVLEPSKLGVARMDGDFTKDLYLIKADQVERVVDSYETRNAKKSKISYEANKYVFHLRNGKGQKLDLIFQLSNDGLAFRYYFPETSKDIRYITEEVTSFNFEDSTIGWLQAMSDAQTGWEHCHPSYEEGYQREIKVGTPSPIKAGWVYPALFKTDKDVYVAITEAGLDGTYCGTRLKADSPKGEYQIGFPQEPEVFTGGELNPESTLPWYSPWRVIAVGSLKTVAESTLGMDVALKAISIKNQDWIKPGLASWSWILLKDESINYDTTKLYIDFAADMRWAYCLIDVNWDTIIGYEKIKELADYAATKNVKLILWYNSAGGWNTTPYHPRNMLLEREGRRKEFKRIKEMGIAGLKIDFFAGDGQSMIRYYLDILEDAADIGLLINFHGSTLPRGWQRTYPHLMTAEAIKGQEMVTFGQDFANEQPAHVVTAVFTRNLFDPMDYTPMTLDSIPRIHRVTTKTFELASTVMFLSGIQHLAESPYGMAKQSDDIKNYLRNLPTHWDETRFLDGYPGKYVLLARRSGSKWYVAGMNGENQLRELQVDLSFLGKGYYFEDSARQESIKKEYTPVSRIILQPNGGYVGVFESK